jgi:hypothetical protein
MGHLRAYLAAVIGKRRVNKTGLTGAAVVFARGLVFAIALSAAMVSGSAGYAQSGTFTGLAGVWSGGGTITLDDGSSERIRCRASYAVGAGGNGLNQTLTCASDSYKFNLASNITAQGGAISGTWTESSRNVSGSIEGHGSNGNFQVIASAAGFNANITLTTRGNKQSVVIKSESVLRAAAISLSRS